MSNNETIWSQVLELIKKTTTSTSYKTWFLPTRIHNIDEELKIVYLEANEEFYANILKNRYLNILEDSFETVMKMPYRVVIKTSDEYKKQDTEIKEETILTTIPGQKDSQIEINLDPQLHRNKPKPADYYPAFAKQRIFNPRYNFDNFVVGNSNKYAYAASVAVAESPSEAYNPLFIYGGSGLGKTHLMHAIGIYLLDHFPDLNVLYISSEMFTNELIKALGDHKTREFKAKYRRVDVLLIDDIQFLEGKETTQEEFFYTFNALHELNKQIVLSSDRPPNELKRLDERLTSRFAWNMVADLTPPDYETRVAILMKKAENMNIVVDDDMYDVICLIAEKIQYNIRELEGAYTRIITFSRRMKEKADLRFASSVLKDIIENGGNNVTPEKIKSVVSRRYKLKIEDLESSTRAMNIAYPRQIAMYLCRSMTGYSFNKIGNMFGGRHYSTVMHACEKIQNDLNNDSELKKMIEILKNEINE